LDIKDILKECKGLDREIEANLELLERLRAREESCTAQLSDMPRGSEVSDKTKITDKRIDLENSLSEIVIKLYERIDQAKGHINTLTNSDQRTVLTEYYLNDKTWEEIAYKTNYTYRHVHRIHGRGLKELNQVKTGPKMS
jgi:predicted DNA-binding protein YlxM (UPF0122 family)